MHEEILKNAGLSEKEAVVYEKMLEIGPVSVGKLLKRVPFKRGDVYNILYSLKNKELLSEDLKDGIMTFTLESPEKLAELVKSEREKLDQREKLVAEAFPQLKSLYNLSIQKPGVRFFEGKEGVWEVLSDTLTSQTELNSYGDIESIVRHIGDMNKRYGRLRAQRGIKKRGIAIDTPFARDYLKNYLKDVTETKLITLPIPAFGTILHVYDSKISYITLSEETKIGVIIDDNAIMQMHKALFDYLWNITPGLVV